MTYQEAKSILKTFIEINGRIELPIVINAMMKAIEAIEKQIPKKPIGKHTNYRCGVCGARVRSGKGSSSHTKDTVCRKCFTVIDWSEDEQQTKRKTW